MDNNIFPNLARGAFTGVLQGLELARIRTERRNQSRRIRVQDASLEALQNNLSSVRNDPNGGLRSDEDVQRRQLQLLTQASVDPNIGQEARDSIGLQARQITSSRGNLRAAGRSAVTGSTASSVNFGFGGTATATDTSTPALNLGAPGVSDNQIPPPADVVEPTVNAVLEPEATTSRRDALRNAGSSANPRPTASVSDSLRTDELAAAPVTSEVTAPTSKRVELANGSQVIVSTQIQDADVLGSIANRAGSLVQSGVLGASDVPELIGLVEQRLISLGVNPSTLTKEAFEQLLQSGQLLT